MINSLNKTFISTSNYKTRKWFLIDCNQQKLGRLATIISQLLNGKLKPEYYPSLDTGDYVILVNANSIILNKTAKHFFSYFPGKPGHTLKIKKTWMVLPKLQIERAVKRMLAKTSRKKLMKRLKIYNTESHLHQAQNPIKIDIANFYPSIK